MYVKNFLISKKNENSVLILSDCQLQMHHGDINSDVFLSTLDFKSGIIHNLSYIIASVDIIKTENSKYAFKNKDNKKYYSSCPMSKDNKIRNFYADRESIQEWESFDLKEVVNKELSVIDYLNFIQNKVYNNPINLYWWRQEDKNTYNLGDELNPYIISFLSKKSVNRTPLEDVDLIGIGSILDWAPEREKPYFVWGSGTLAPTTLLESRNYKISLLRGPLTHSLLFDSKQILAYGDPGLLCSTIWEQSSEFKYNWGLIVHHSQYNQPWIKHIMYNTPKILLIDVENKNIYETIKQISSCKAIASTSLHGLVIADSYRIPNIWLWDDYLHDGGQWKFFDYFSGIGRHYIDNISPYKISNLNDINLSKFNYSYFNKIDKICNRIIDTFPF